MKDIVGQITRAILEDSRGLFDDDSVEDLRVTVRIAHDFNAFLDRFIDDPPLAEIVYISDTIRSGIDQFFSLAHMCAVIKTDDENWWFLPKLSWEYNSLRAEFLDRFVRLSESLDTSANQRLSCLLALTHMELAFLARHFPAAILTDLSERVRQRRGAGKR